MRPIAAAALVVLLGCQASKEPNAGPLPSPVEASAQPVETGSPSALLEQLEQFGHSFGSSRAELQQRLGSPVGVQVEVEPNLHGPTTDSIFRIGYPGLRFHLLRAGYDGREFLGNVDLWTEAQVAPGGIRVGSTTYDELTSRLGPATESELRADTLVLAYLSPDDVVEQYTKFKLVADTLRAIRWDFYID